jgi:cAMP phosphodiesterase
MKLQVLGSAGGIGGREQFTTCLRLDEDILFDAGTGVSVLGLEQIAGIRHVFLTHGHLDHVAGLALLADTILGARGGPVTVHASEQVIDSLKTHLFNWVLWPDFAALPDVRNPVLRWAPLAAGQRIEIGGRTVVPHAVNHSAGSVAYRVRASQPEGSGGFLFSGDMCSTPALWTALMHDEGLRQVIVDCSFPNAEAALAARSGHFCPSSLLADISAMQRSIEFLICHLKPGQEERIMDELNVGDRAFKALRCGDVHEFE